MPKGKDGQMERLDHPCQFPVGLAQRLVNAPSAKLGVVFDSFAGSASTGVEAISGDRRFLGAEIDHGYGKIAVERLMSAYNGTVRFRRPEQPLCVASAGDAVSQRPKHFLEVPSEWTKG